MTIHLSVTKTMTGETFALVKNSNNTVIQTPVLNNFYLL